MKHITKGEQRRMTDRDIEYKGVFNPCTNGKSGWAGQYLKETTYIVKLCLTKVWTLFEIDIKEFKVLI